MKLLDLLRSAPVRPPDESANTAASRRPQIDVNDHFAAMRTLAQRASMTSGTVTPPIPQLTVRRALDAERKPALMPESAMDAAAFDPHLRRPWAHRINALMGIPDPYPDTPPPTPPQVQRRPSQFDEPTEEEARVLPAMQFMEHLIARVQTDVEKLGPAESDVIARTGMTKSDWGVRAALLPLAFWTPKSPEFHAWLGDLIPQFGKAVERSEYDTLQTAALEHLVFKAVRAEGLQDLMTRATQLGARDCEIIGNTTLQFTTGSPPETSGVRFDFARLDAEGRGEPATFFGVRSWTFGQDNDVAQTIVNEATQAFRKRLTPRAQGPFSITNPAQIVLFSADYAKQLKLDNLLSIFEEYGFSWAKAKTGSRTDTRRSDGIHAVEKAIEAETGVPLTIAREGLGNVKMWAINDLRRHYFYEPLLKAAQETFRPNTASPVKVEVQAPGSRDCDSDIDGTVLLDPDQERHWPDFMEMLFGNATRPGLIYRRIEEIAQLHPGLTSRSAAEVFDVNFYSPGFMYRASPLLLFSPFYTSTREGTEVKAQMDTGAAMKRILERVPELAVEGTLAEATSSASVDYGLLRVCANSLLQAKTILQIWPNTGAAEDVQDAKRRLQEITQRAAMVSPIERLMEGPLSADDRTRLAKDVADLREAIDVLEHSSMRSLGSPIVERASQLSLVTFGRELAALQNEREVLLTQFIEAQADGNVEPGLVQSLRAALDMLALQAVDAQVAITSESPEAYASAAAVHRVVAGRQMDVAQHRDPLVAANAALDDCGFTLHYKVHDFLKREGVNPALATPEQEQKAFGEYLLAVSKYMERLTTHIQDVDNKYWAGNCEGRGLPAADGQTFTSAAVMEFATALLKAKKAKHEPSALTAASNMFLNPRSGDDVVGGLALTIALIAQSRSRQKDKAVREAETAHLNAMDELAQRVDIIK